MENGKTKHRGESVDIEGTTYVLPAVPLGFFRKNPDALALIGAAGKGGLDPADTTVKVLFPMICASFQRNYPELDDDAIEDLVDALNYNQVLEAVFKASGFTWVKPGETQPVAN